MMKNTLRSIIAFAMFAAFSAFGQSASVSNFAQGWSLNGNSMQDTLNVVKTFGNYQNFVPGVTQAVVTVWKWNAPTSRWAFYTTRMDSNNLANYAANKGYDVLTEIFPGEGYWVFAETEAAVAQVSFPANYLLDNWNMGGLPSGWNLLASPVKVTPSEISTLLTSTPPTVADAGLNSSLVTLWMWDTVLANWYFYAPSLAACGPDCLNNYVSQRGLLNFSWTGKVINPGDGFWANIQPSQPPPVPTVCTNCKG